jgi:hypothetical protein
MDYGSLRALELYKTSWCPVGVATAITETFQLTKSKLDLSYSIMSCVWLDFFDAFGPHTQQNYGR